MLNKTYHKYYYQVFNVKNKVSKYITYITIISLFTLSFLLANVSITPAYAATPIIEEIEATKSDSTVTLTLTVRYNDISWLVDDVKSTSDITVYSQLDFACAIDVEIDGVSHIQNTSMWTVDWEEERLTIIDESKAPAADSFKLHFVEYLMRDVTGNPTLRFRAQRYRFPTDVYEWGAWTESQTLEDLLPAESTSPCVIATATYGSELTPQVQFLRSFRDNRVLQTFAGSQFMAVFNSFYYSFSPDVADSIRGNDPLRAVMQVILYPLVGVLQVSEGIFSLLSFNPEVAVVLTGCVASVLLAVMYLVPWALLLSYIRNYRPSRTMIAALGIIWLASLTAIGLAEFTHAPSLMMTATGTFVLATLAITVVSILHHTPKLIKSIR
jgi:peptide/nickel transport system substrate-binding protein